MKIVIVAIGSRGDVEPFLAIGQILNEKGHCVICAFPEQFRNLTKETDLEFSSLGDDFINVLNSEYGKAVMGARGSVLKKILAYIKFGLQQRRVNIELDSKQYAIIESEKPDKILYNGKATYPIIWELKNKGKTVLISYVPYMHYVKGHTHIVFASNFGTLLNKFTFSIVYSAMVTAVMLAKNRLKIADKISRKEIREVIENNKTIYTISPTLFPRAEYWPENRKILGYYQRNKSKYWQPSKKLSDFIKGHANILFITFGSMLNPSPDMNTKIFIDILERNKISAIINIASGGLVKPDNFDSKFIYFVSYIPYTWILPKVYGVIHHGGSGTTHLALKYGCVTMIIPHILDQFLWNKIIFNLGVGPKGIKIGKINTKKLEAKILDLVSNTGYKKKSEQISDNMIKENFKEELYQAIIES